MVDAIRKSGRRRLWLHCTSNLTTSTHDSMYISIVTGVIHSYKIENDNMIVITKVSNMRF